MVRTNIVNCVQFLLKRSQFAYEISSEICADSFLINLIGIVINLINDLSIINPLRNPPYFALYPELLLKGHA